MPVKPPALPRELSLLRLDDAVDTALAEGDTVSDGQFQDDYLEEKSGRVLDFSRCLFRRVQFCPCDFERMHFTDCRFEGCDLSGFQMRGGTLRKSELTDCRGTGLLLQRMSLRDVRFQGCQLDYAGFVDSRLQAGAWYALNGRRGAVVVLNYKTGEILCMVSAPSYDPAVGQRRDAEGMYINRCTGGLFIPGSIYKLVTLCCACETLPDLKSRTFHCDGELVVNGKTVHCTGVHGEQTIEQALANSCNAAFAALTMELGGERIRSMARKLGVEGPLSWGGGVTAAGRFDVAARRTAPEAWSGIGQYNDLVTPYAMARLCAAIANGGTVHEGVLRAGDVGRERRLLDEKTAEYVGACMNYNVVYAYGKNNFPWLDLCAKTGTAELGDGTTHAWFVGYLHSGAPLAFAVLLEQGGGGLAQAGPVANHVLQLANGYYAS